MNRTTVKRGIGAVILALIAASLLAFLLKDKAAQRQDVVDMALPGTDGGVETASNSTRLPQLSTDNSGNGTVVAQAGQESVNIDPDNTAVQQVSDAGATLLEDANDTTGKVIASVAAAGAAAGGAIAATGDAVANKAKETISFDVRANQQSAASTAASGEFRELDLVNNGADQAPAASTSSADQTQASQPAAQQSTPAAEKPDQGTVIASTKPSKVAKSSNAGQARLIDEKKTKAPKSSKTAKVITKKAPAKPVKKEAEVKQEPAPQQQAPVAAKNGYAIQLLATSSASRANDLKNVMAGEGYPTYITKTQQNGKLLYRVRIGQYTTRAAAAKTQAAMKRRYKKNKHVNGSAIVAR